MSGRWYSKAIVYCLDAPRGTLADRTGPDRAGTGTTLFVHDMSDEPAVVGLGSPAGEAGFPNDVLADQECPEPDILDKIQVACFGYRWIRMRRTA